MFLLDLHCLLSEHDGEGRHQIQPPPWYRLEYALLLPQDLFALGPQEISAVTFSLQESSLI